VRRNEYVRRSQLMRSAAGQSSPAPVLDRIGESPAEARRQVIVAVLVASDPSRKSRWAHTCARAPDLRGACNVSMNVISLVHNAHIRHSRGFGM
jgi:hypothetical protein